MKVHFIAIGGSVMHNLAIMLQKQGYQISGSDDEIFDPARAKLANSSLLPAKIGWFPEKLDKGIDAVILGMHAKSNNSELVQAQELGLKIYSYPEFIYQYAKNKKRVVIAGSHGKTTITSMIMHVLKTCNQSFDFVVGAPLDGFEVMVQLTQEADTVVIEGDEYLASPIDKRPKFLFYKPHLSVITGISWDHINVFPSKEIYAQQFENFIQSLPTQSKLIFFNQDPILEALVRNINSSVTCSPYDTHPYKMLDNVTYLLDKRNKRIPLKIFGKHNLENISAAKMVCDELGVKEDDFLNAISTYEGARNRLQVIGKNAHTTIFSDFAHSPSKLSASIHAVKNQFPKRKLFACLELHTFSSLDPGFLKEYRGRMEEADVGIIYVNPESMKRKNLPSLQKKQIKSAFNRENLKIFLDDSELQVFLKDQSWSDTNLLMMSSGSFNNLDLKYLSKFVLGHNQL